MTVRLNTEFLFLRKRCSCLTMSLTDIGKTIMTEQRNMQMNAEKENESEFIEQRILKMRAEIVEIEKEIAEIRKESERRSAKMEDRIIAIREGCDS